MFSFGGASHMATIQCAWFRRLTCYSFVRPVFQNHCRRTEANGMLLCVAHRRFHEFTSHPARTGLANVGEGLGDTIRSNRQDTVAKIWLAVLSSPIANTASKTSWRAFPGRLETASVSQSPTRPPRGRRRCGAEATQAAEAAPPAQTVVRAVAAAAVGGGAVGG